MKKKALLVLFITSIFIYLFSISNIKTNAFKFGSYIEGSDPYGLIPNKEKSDLEISSLDIVFDLDDSNLKNSYNSYIEYDNKLTLKYSFYNPLDTVVKEKMFIPVNKDESGNSEIISIKTNGNDIETKKYYAYGDFYFYEDILNKVLYDEYKTYDLIYEDTTRSTITINENTKLYKYTLEIENQTRDNFLGFVNIDRLEFYKYGLFEFINNGLSVTMFEGEKMNLYLYDKDDITEVLGYLKVYSDMNTSNPIEKNIICNTNYETVNLKDIILESRTNTSISDMDYFNGVISNYKNVGSIRDFDVNNYMNEYQMFDLTVNSKETIEVIVKMNISPMKEDHTNITYYNFSLYLTNSKFKDAKDIKLEINTNRTVNDFYSTNSEGLKKKLFDYRVDLEKETNEIGFNIQSDKDKTKLNVVAKTLIIILCIIFGLPVIFAVTIIVIVKLVDRNNKKKKERRNE